MKHRIKIHTYPLPDGYVGYDTWIDGYSWSYGVEFQSDDVITKIAHSVQDDLENFDEIVSGWSLFKKVWHKIF